MANFPSFLGIPEISEREGTLLLKVPDGRVDLPGAPIRLPEGEFRPKEELHVTVIGRGSGARLREADVNSAHLETLAAGHEWTIYPRDAFWMIEAPPKPGYQATRYSLIQLVDLPDLRPFMEALADTSGFQLSAPPPHLTWYTRNWDQGIGLDSEAEFRERRVRRLDPLEVQMVIGEY